MKKKETNREGEGFVIVATKNDPFFFAAMRLAESILDFWPEARITLYTEEKWINGPESLLEPDWYQMFENVITWEVPNHIRAKLWALEHTPYKTTCYLDCDMYCEHEDIKDIFKTLGDKDLVFTKIRPYNAKVTKLSNTEEMTAHCGWFVYNDKPQTLALMSAWYGEYLKQNENEKGVYTHPIGDYPDDVRKWDTFTMWKLLTYSEHGVDWGFVEEPDARWNFVNGYHWDELGGLDPVLYHYTIKNHEQTK